MHRTQLWNTPSPTPSPAELRKRTFPGLLLWSEISKDTQRRSFTDWFGGKWRPVFMEIWNLEVRKKKNCPSSQHPYWTRAYIGPPLWISLVHPEPFGYSCWDGMNQVHFCYMRKMQSDFWHGSFWMVISGRVDLQALTTEGHVRLFSGEYSHA